MRTQGTAQRREREMRTCLQCGDEFGVSADERRKKLYCSDSCKNASYANRHTLECGYCGDTFGSKQHDALHCSRGCANAARDTLSNSIRSCAICDNEFTPRSQSHMCCSQECGRAQRQRTKIEQGIRQLPQVECGWCGKTFGAKMLGDNNGDVKLPACCSVSHGLKHAYDPDKSKWLLKARCDHGSWSLLPGRDCDVCGKWMERNGSSCLCSDECRDTRNEESYARAVISARVRYEENWVNPGEFICEECGETFVNSYGETRRSYCSDRCRNRYLKRTRRARVRGAMIGDTFGLYEISDRDHGICQLCMGKVDASKTAPHRDSPTIDHIVPIAKGGEHSYANVQLAHFLCNSKKGDRRAGSQTRMF